LLWKNSGCLTTEPLNAQRVNEELEVIRKSWAKLVGRRARVPAGNT